MSCTVVYTCVSRKATSLSDLDCSISSIVMSVSVCTVVVDKLSVTVSCEYNKHNTNFQKLNHYDMQLKKFTRQVTEVKFIANSQFQHVLSEVPLPLVELLSDEPH